MKHLGNLCDLLGWTVPSVDILTGGSPCQNLSMAGNRKGLAGNESGLFLEQIRLFKEMRDASAASGSLRRPRFFVWENVKGAFSCNGGEDFRRVLEEVVRIAEPDASVPRPPSEEGWTPSGAILGDGWSLAWRLHDAQFWGVPQRRARIALVADFGGQSAPEILFERKGVQGDFGAGETAGQGAAGGAGEGAPGAGSISFVERMGKPGGGKGLLIRDEQAGTLDTSNTQAVCVEPRGTREPRFYTDKSPTINCAGGQSHPVRAQSRSGGQVNSYGFKGMMGAKAKGIAFEAEKSPTLNLSESQVLVERKEAKE
jgi:DNA (cytosine-5)-methyltransferase 1